MGTSVSPVTIDERWVGAVSWRVLECGTTTIAGMAPLASVQAWAGFCLVHDPTQLLVPCVDRGAWCGVWGVESH